MDHPKTYLLKKIIGHETNGYTSLGRLSGEHVEDVAKLMNEFAKEVILEILPILNKGESVNIDGLCLQLKPKKKTK